MMSKWRGFREKLENKKRKKHCKSLIEKISERKIFYDLNKSSNESEIINANEIGGVPQSFENLLCEILESAG